MDARVRFVTGKQLRRPSLFSLSCLRALPPHSAETGQWGLTLGPLNKRGSFLLAHILPDQADLLDQFGLQAQEA
jgi:hypothetical protein